MVHYAETRYGFEYGAAEVTRLASHPEKGWAVVSIRPRDVPRKRHDAQEVQVCVSKTGKVTVFVGHEKVWPPRPAGD